ncbi:MAG: hypothetical protein NTX50_25490, partial [Candidatus Sumerlaeota bacterium]|nr:hypothetical protein [Candidatus Sumerlaeota bacterium]
MKIESDTPLIDARGESFRPIEGYRLGVNAIKALMARRRMVGRPAPSGGQSAPRPSDGAGRPTIRRKSGKTAS